MKATVGGQFQGLNTKLPSSRLALNGAQTATNCTFDRPSIRKRGGWSSLHTYTDSGALTGIWDWTKDDGTVVQIVKQGGKIHQISDLGGTPSYSEISTAIFSTTALGDAAVVRNRMYVCDGTSFRVTDGSSHYAAQIPRPSSLALV